MAKIKIPDGKGFDVVIWQRGATSPAWACPYTNAGLRFLRKFIPKAAYKEASNLDGVFPEQMLKEVPLGLIIGGISPGARVPMRLNPSLH